MITHSVGGSTMTTHQSLVVLSRHNQLDGDSPATKGLSGDIEDAPIGISLAEATRLVQIIMIAQGYVLLTACGNVLSPI